MFNFNFEKYAFMLVFSSLVIIMVPEELLQVRWYGNEALTNVDRRVGNGFYDRVWCLLEYSSGDLNQAR